jgi:hypothetical protein
MNRTHRPLTYIICARGQIPACWMDAFSDLAITKETDDCGDVTRLSGTFDDSAALQGVLNNLLTLGLSLISVEAQDECSSGRRLAESGS